MSTLEERFQNYSHNTLDKQEVDDAIFNFLGFVKTCMLIAKDNEERRNESSNPNSCIQQSTRRRKIS